MSQDMSGRLEPIYRKLIIEPGQAGPAGLTAYRLRQNSGYQDEILYVGKRRGTPFVVRCLAPDAARQVVAACERDVHVGSDLSLLYRFPAELLPDWRQLDEKISSFAQRLIGG